MHVCGKDCDHAGQVWRRVPEIHKTELHDSLTTFNFPGRGQSVQNVITFPGAIKLMMFLPDENAKKHRSTMVKILQGYFAGNPSLLAEKEANAASSHPIAEMARESLEANVGEKRGASVELEVSDRRQQMVAFYREMREQLEQIASEQAGARVLEHAGRGP